MSIVAPGVSTQQLQEVDRRMVADYGIVLLQMMENAGRNLADLARRMLAGDVVDRPIVVLAGKGNNGGGGMAAARHLYNAGAWVQVICSYPQARYQGAPAQQLATLQTMGVPLAWAEDGWELPPADLVIDAIIGYGLRGAPRGNARNLIQLANSSAAPVLSLDTPSGVDTDAGIVYTPHIQATATLTLALPKLGFLAPDAQAACGDLYLADISVPSSLYAELGIQLDGQSLFARNSIARLYVVDGEFRIAGEE